LTSFVTKQYVASLSAPPSSRSSRTESSSPSSTTHSGRGHAHEASDVQQTSPLLRGSSSLLPSPPDSSPSGSSSMETSPGSNPLPPVHLVRRKL
jgi:hypothetical protein